jgi:clathrin heavy chain
LHGYVEELATYLYNDQLFKYIEIYCVKVNPPNTPTFVGTLIDLDCAEDFLKKLLQAVRATCPVKELVEECEKRNRLRILQGWLEARQAEGNQETMLHNALAMIYIDTNRDPENFLKNNAYYDSAVVGKFCEERDPHLAYTAYRARWGTCDDQLVEVTNKNGLYRLQARYLVERQNIELWQKVLDPTNEHRKAVVDQVIATALPECNNADEVSICVKAFISAELQTELIELLEKIVLHKSEFSQVANLQDLLILTAARADKKRVMDYINRLSCFNGPDIATVCLGAEFELYEEAFVIYKKEEMHENAMDVLLNNIKDVDRAAEYAARVGDNKVWAKLGKAALNTGGIADAIESYIKAEDASDYMDVIAAAEREGKFDDLVRYLKMARKHQKDQHLDSELVYSYARVGNLADMEEFISGSTTANTQLIGERLYDEGAYQAAQILFTAIKNNAKLAACYVKLGRGQG